MDDQVINNPTDQVEDAVEKEQGSSINEDVTKVIDDQQNDLKAQMDEFKDKYMRTYAEMENLKKRHQRDRQDLIRYSNETLLKDFLQVYDAIEKAISTAIELHPDDEDFIHGLRMTEKLFVETLKKNNVEPIESLNTAFDPNYHEAMMQEKRDDLEQGMVVREIEKGFMISERVLRPAKVTVSG